MDKPFGTKACPHAYPYYSEKEGKFQAIWRVFAKQKNFHAVDTDVDRLFTECVQKKGCGKKRKRVHPKRSEKGNGGKVVHQTANIVEKARTGFRQTVEKKKDV